VLAMFFANLVHLVLAMFFANLVHLLNQFLNHPYYKMNKKCIMETSAVYYVMQ